MPFFKKTFLSLLLLGVVLSPVQVALADEYGLQATAGAAGLADNPRYPSDVPTLIGNVIGTALSMVAVIFFLLMVYGGFLWMTAHGDSGQVDKAKDTIIAAVIGIIVVLASYAITTFVFTATSGAPASNGNPTPSVTEQCTQTKGPGFSCRTRDNCDDVNQIFDGLCPAVNGAETVCCN